jgi:vacuolar-type H+-ATPase subunit E/Vma4
MSLEAILSKIERDAEEKAAAILRAAEQKRDMALQDHESKLEKEFQQQLEKLQVRIDETLKRREFHARREETRKMMNARRAMMDRAISKAVERLASAEDKRYLVMISRLLEGCDLKGEIQVIISSGDECRITEAFLKKHSDSGKKFVLSDDRHELGGGVIMRSGDISQNGTFPMIAKLAHEQLIMKLSSLIPLEEL